MCIYSNICEQISEIAGNVEKSANICGKYAKICEHLIKCMENLKNCENCGNLQNSAQISVAILAQDSLLSFHSFPTRAPHGSLALLWGKQDINIAIRFGRTLAHVPSVAGGVILMKALNEDGTRGHTMWAASTSDDPEFDVLTGADRAACQALELLIKPCGLAGKATKCFGTALRASVVRG